MQPANSNQSVTTPHGNLLVYKRTRDFTYPLILVIGREPNTERKVENFVENYDFDLARRCGFWNSSYSLVARKTHFKIARCLKEACREKESSPIIYADALPNGIPHNSQSKGDRRRETLPEDISRHVANIFSHRKIIDRVSLVFLSGLDAPEFRVAVNAINSRIQDIQVAAITLKFFTSINAPAHVNAVSDENQKLLKRVIKAWLRTGVNSNPAPENDN